MVAVWRVCWEGRAGENRVRTCRPRALLGSIGLYWARLGVNVKNAEQSQRRRKSRPRSPIQDGWVLTDTGLLGKAYGYVSVVGERAGNELWRWWEVVTRGRHKSVRTR